MTIFNSENVLDRNEQLIPQAAANGELYFKALVRHARESAAPVDVDVVEEPVSGGFRPKKELFLRMIPTESRFRRYPLYNFARPVGTSLNVGYYLVGGTAARGIGGWVVLGGASREHMDDLQSLVSIIEQTCIVPAIHEAAGTPGATPGGAQPRGFFGA